MRSTSLLSRISSEEDELSRSVSSTIGGDISTEFELQMRCTSLLRRISSEEDKRSMSVSTIEGISSGEDKPFG